MTLLSRDMTAGEIAQLLNAEVVGDAGSIVRGVATYSSHVRDSLSYQSVGAERSDVIERTVVCSADNAGAVAATARIVVDDPRAAFMNLIGNLQLDWQTTILAQAQGLELGEYEAHPSVVIEQPAIIGRGVVLEPHVVVRKGVVIGHETLVGAGTVIGEAGRAFHKCADGRVLSWARLHVGTIYIGSHCQIGANSAIDRAMLGQTRIGGSTVLGNLCHVGHGVAIGERAWLSTGCVVSGHATVGNGASIGLGVLVRDNVDIGERASVGMGSVVVKSVPAGESVLGAPARRAEHPFKAGPTL